MTPSVESCAFQGLGEFYLKNKNYVSEYLRVSLTVTILVFLKSYLYLWIWLSRVLVVALWDPVPRLGMEPEPLALGAESSSLDHEESPYNFSCTTPMSLSFSSYSLKN